MADLNALQQGITAVQNGELEEGARLLNIALRDETLQANLRVIAYLWLAETTADLDQKIAYHNQALAVEPDNADVMQRLAVLMSRSIRRTQSQDTALRSALNFARRFGERHTTLAMVAALPLGLTPELVHLLRVNFVPTAPWIAEADLLLSDLCTEVGGEMYEMLPDVRALLVEELRSDSEFNIRQQQRVAAFIYEYSRRQLVLTRQEERRDFLRAQQWAALAYGQPQAAAQALALAMRHALEGGTTPGAVRIAGLIDRLASPLAGNEKVLLYAAGVQHLAEGRLADAQRALRALGPADEAVNVENVVLASPARLAAKFGITSPDDRPPSDRDDRSSVVGITDAFGGSATGFFISDDGWIATTRRAVGSLENVTVALADGQQLTGRVMRSFPEYDLAFVQVSHEVDRLLPTVDSRPYSEMPLRAIRHDGEIINGQSRETQRKIRDAWLPTSFIGMFGDGGEPLLNERDQLVGMLTRNTSGVAGYYFGLFIHTIRELRQQSYGVTPSSSEVYCRHCGNISKARRSGAFYCEHCGEVLPTAEDIRRSPLPGNSLLYDNYEAPPCPNCNARVGYYEGRCLRCDAPFNDETPSG